MTLLTLLACAVTEGSFLSGSGRFVPSRGSDSGDTGYSDTADTGGEDTVGDAGAPILVDASISWDDFPDFGIVLVFAGTFTDEGDDFIGGTCYIDVYQDGEFVDTFDVPASDDESDNDRQVCLVVGDSLTFAIPDLDSTKSAGIDISVRDSSGNTSPQYTYETDAL